MTTPTLFWNITDLIQSLKSQPQVKDWIIHHTHLHRLERYFMKEPSLQTVTHDQSLILDQDREVKAETIELKICVKLDKANRQGEMSKQLTQHEPLAPQLESAIKAALKTDHQQWNLPDNIPHELPMVATADPAILENIHQTLNEVSDRIRFTVAQEKKSTFNSSEIFLVSEQTENYLSNGLRFRSRNTKAYVEAAFSYQTTGNQPVISDEYLATSWSVDLEELPVESIFKSAANRVREPIEAAHIQKPKTGTYSVLIEKDIASSLLNSIVNQLNSGHDYQHLPFIKIGDDFIQGAHEGDLLTITLDPTLEFGGSSQAIDEYGVIQKPLRLVDRNHVVGSVTSKRFSDYLSKPITTSHGNIVVQPGTRSYEELITADNLVLEILQFSGIFIDGSLGTFGSEIRLAKLHDRQKGGFTWIKGGSISGSIQENFKRALFSKKCSKHAYFEPKMKPQGYFGPEHILLRDVSVVG